MPTSWKRADKNVLRAHLQAALAERAASAEAGDWSYSDYEVEAIRAELAERQIVHEVARARASPDVPPGVERERDDGSQAAIDIDIDRERTRILIARCFRPSGHVNAAGARRGSELASASELPGRPRANPPSADRFARLRRLF